MHTNVQTPRQAGTGKTPLADAGPSIRPTGRRARRSWGAAVAAGVAAAVTLAPMPASAHRAPPDTDPSRDPTTIAEWNQVAMDVLTPSGRPLLTQPFVVAAMHVAMYDAVVAIDGGFAPYGAQLTAPSGASPAAAAAAAAHDVLVGFLPGSAPTFDAALADSLAAIPDGAGESAGLEVGKAAAAATLADRLDDGSQSGPVPPLPPADPGRWQPTPPATSGLTQWLAHAEPFGLRSNDQLRPPPPPALGSGRFRRGLDEVRRLGGSTSALRTAEQTTIARFWGDQPVAQSQRALRGRAASLDWEIGPMARLFAAVLTSQADAFIACWDAKYHYTFWRPWQSVPTVEPGWTPLLTTPNHPEFPSAHGCLTGSTAHALAQVLGTKRIELDVDAVSIGVTRHYDTVHELLREVRDARVWGGVHYPFSVDTGLRLARQVVAYNLSRNFQPAPS